MMKKQSLHRGWQGVKLGDVCDFIRGVSYKPQESSFEPKSGYLPILRAGNIGDRLDIENDLVWVTEKNISNEQRFQIGDIAICMASGSPTVVGKTAQLKQKFDGSIGAFCGIIRPKDEVVSNYIFHWLRSQDFLRWRDSQARGANIQNLRFSQFVDLIIPIPPLEEQKRIAARLDEQMRHVEQARQATEEQLSLLTHLVNSYFRESLQRKTTKMHLSDCMVEVKKGVGETWAQYPVLGATRAGVAPAKEKVGKQPQRYKLVEPGTIFYNPMRIMIGSIAMLDDGDESGITSPDYVVLKGKEGILHPRWFYYWFRSPYGENFIKSLARGAVRERMLFNRLDKGEIELPDWDTQVKIAEKLKEIKTFKQALESQLAEINELPSALLRQAFAGEISK